MKPTRTRADRLATRLSRRRAAARARAADAPSAAHVQPLESRVLMAADFRISEFMASNVSTLADENAEYNDWVEIRNVGDTSGDLAGYRLTDDPALPAKWTFPSVTVPDGGHLVVFASGKNRTNPAANLHTNFSLNGDGEYLALSGPDGVARSTFAPYPDQEEDVSYGTDFNFATRPLRYFAEPTPGAANARAEVVINEIHYDPDVKTQLVEFVELHNPGTAPVDLSGAFFSDGITYTFAAGTTLAPGAYLLLAQDAAQFQTKYGVAPHGQYVGALSNEGETVRLRNAAGGTLDMVDYQPGFPWPTVGDAPGYSIELINPDFENDVGGNWRAAPPPTGGGTQLFASNGAWRYAKGTAAPPADWTQVNSPGTAGWANGNGPVGYDGDTAMGTPLADMRNTYTSVYLRKTFNVADPLAFGSLRLEAVYDDGFNVYINGTHVYSQNVPSANVPFDGRATASTEERSYVPFNLSTSALRAGTNVIAVHFLNVDITNSSDAYFDARLIATPGGASPSPGRRNSVFAANAAPQMRQVDHFPKEPRAGEVVTITSKITDPDGVASASLRYQLVDPGNYVAVSDPAYEANWTVVPMRDDGAGGDVLAHDGIYTAQLPASVQVHRRLVRYRVTAADALGASITAPYADDSVPNFAYFVYNGVPGWTGAVQPGVTAPVSFSAEVMGSVEPFHLISKQTDVEDATWWSRYGGDNYLWEGALVYDGKVYDHIRYRTRGGVAWRYAMGKNAWKIDFNHNHELEMKDDYGRPYDTKWGKLSLRANIQQGNFWHRGEGGLFESAGYKLFNLAGTPAERTTFAQLRIIDAPAEATANQYEGDFWGSYLAIEEPDGAFLDEHGLPDGNIYDMEGGTGTLNNQGPTAVTDKSDLNSFQATYQNGANPPTEQWWRDNLHLAEYYAYRVIVEGIHHFDIADGKNYFYYLNPETNKWMVLPWDLDLTWSNNMYGGGEEPFKIYMLNRAANAGINIEYDNAIRHIRDLLFNPDQAGQVIDEMAAKIWTKNQPSFVDADRAMWDYNPVMTDPTRTYGDKGGAGRFYAGGPGVTIPGPGGFEGMINKMKAYVAERAALLDSFADNGLAPVRPGLAYLGAAGYPADDLRFQSGTYSDPQGNPFAAMEWRLAEVTNPNAPGYDPKAPKKYEIDALWTSGELTTFNRNVTVPGQYVEAGKTYRVRVRWKDSTGRWSNWSNPQQFVAGAGDATVKDSLRITEIGYHPAPNPAGAPAEDEFEFVELLNTGTDPLNLKDVHFDDGIEYRFDADYTLQPGAYVVIARNRLAFVQRYGAAAEAFLAPGVFLGSLNNSSDRLVLLDATNQEIHNFTYFDTWHPTTDGDGPSLVIRDPAGPIAAWGEATGGGWRPSQSVHGSPGRADTQGDTTAPTVDITDVTPDPRNAPVDSVTIVFSEPVVGFTIADLALVRDGGASLLTAAQTLSSTDGGRTWTLGNLSALTGASGSYTLRLDAAGSGIADAAGNPLAVGATDAWTTDATRPTADIVDVTPDPRGTPVDSIRIVFSEPVTGFGLSDLLLVSTEAISPVNLLTGAQTLTTTDNVTWTLGNLAGITGPLGGGYELLLRSTGTGITDAVGNALSGGASDRWRVGAVFGRHVFYNGSSYDGRNPGTGAADDAAIAADKQALLPGGQGTFANITSFASGINGIMIDIAGMPPVGHPINPYGVAVFRVGNGGDPATWALAPDIAFASFSRRPGAGVNGSERVTFTWANGAIKNKWLQVTVLANSVTGLAAPDVFYFGNLVGETGDAGSPRRVSAVDVSGTRARMGAVSNLAGRYDFNRDGRVNSIDLALVRLSQNQTLGVPSTPAVAASSTGGGTFSQSLIQPAGTTTTSRFPTRRTWYEESGDLLA